MGVAAANSHPEDWAGLFLAGAMVAMCVSFGIIGLVVHAAAGKGERPPFGQVVALLFLPLLWLQIKIGLITFIPLFAALFGWHAVAAPTEPIETWSRLPIWYAQPLIGAVTLVLTVYATPFAVRQRATGRPGAPIREGLRLMVDRASGGPRLLLLIVPAIALQAIALYLGGRENDDPVPTVPEGLLLLVISYLTLAAVFGAARLLARRAAAAAEAARRADPGGFGTPAAGPGA